MDAIKHLLIESQGKNRYAIHFASLEELPALMHEAGLRKGKCVVCTDDTVQEYYLSRTADVLRTGKWTVKTVVLPSGENTKSTEHLHSIYDSVLSWKIDRQTPLFALGGGVIGDLAGFAAATLLRGIPLVHLPTSLIAQVDSSIGGKTGINHSAGKNLIGAFYPPALICTDLSTLATLPERQWTSGLAEVVKHACIRDEDFLFWLLAHWDDVIERQPGAIRHMVPRAASIKIDVVERDEHERGERAILNFGHTFGHAIERVTGYGRFTHGEAVALGMRAALHLSKQLHPEVSFDDVEALLRGLPQIPPLDQVTADDLMRATRTDKKVVGSTVRYIVLRRPGEAYVRADIDESLVRASWEHILHVHEKQG